ncbi:MAG: gamma-glutamylcyclotransferase family protein [Pseudomonadota bacterium]
MTGQVALFCYGTLQQPEVQRANYGRLLEGKADVLAGYRLTLLNITDPQVVGISGKAVHTIARATDDPADRIPGTVFELTEQELVATDRYEVDAYARIAVTLESGRRAFVYVAPAI